MARHVMIRAADGESVAQETELLAEKQLHDVLTQYPELLPVDDLGMGEIVVVGRESPLESGYADLVAIDESGRVCLVEVKKEGNPDTRRVVAQLLDYAAALWKLSVPEFERIVFDPFRQKLDAVDGDALELAQFVARHFEHGGDAGAQDAAAFDEEVFARGLETTLSDGSFRLVVAAPGIPAGVQKVIEYLNAHGERLYGLEVSFFGGPVECFVPRLAVRPRVSEAGKVAGATSKTTEEELLSSVPELVVPIVRQFLTDVGALAAHVKWNTASASISPLRTPSRVLFQIEPTRVYVTVLTPNGYPSEPFDAALAALNALNVGKAGKDGWLHSVAYAEASESQLRAYFEVALELVKELSPTIDLVPLESPISVDFTRSDNIIWAKQVPALASKVGSWLFGTLENSGGQHHPTVVTLSPLANGGAGWLPHFQDAAAASLLWAPNDFHGAYHLTIDQSGRR